MRKRGMVSVFIIVGLFLFLIIALAISMQIGIIPSILPKKANAVTVFTESCLSAVAFQGTAIMKLQGGYIELPDDIKLESAYIDSGFKIPYWYYEGKNYAPTRIMMEKELGEYVLKEIKACLNDFKEFPQFEIIPLGNMSTWVVIDDEDVAVKLQYNLQIRQHGDEEYTYVSDFHSNQDTKLGRMHDLAIELMRHENSRAFLEDYTMEMIASSDYLPHEGMDITCRPQSWYKPEMAEYTKNLVMHNLHFLMFENTDYEETGIPYYDGQYKVDFTDTNYNDMGVDVIYNPAWEMEYDVYPSKKMYVEPIDFTINKFILTCVQVYHHRYTLDYPVMFKVDSDTNEVFFFATPVVLLQDQSNRYSEVLPWTLPLSEEFGYCSNSTKITVFSADSAGNMIATPAIRDKRRYSLRVFARDIITGATLPYANISYQCVSDRCSIGQTSYPRENGYITGGLPLLNTKFPDCNGGYVMAEKQNYHIGREQFSVTDQTDGSQVNVEMHPLKKLNYEFVVVQDHNNLITQRSMEPDEYVMMTITNDDMEFEESIVWPSEDEYFSDLSLITGDITYELEIRLVNDDKYLGGLEMNWTTSTSDMVDARMVRFYVIKKDPLLPPSSPEEYQALIDYAMDNSKNYPPEVI